MTAKLADFIVSDEGEIYDRVCRQYGLDPGAIFDDDALAFQARLGFMRPRDTTTPEPAAPDDWESQAEANRREWLGG